MFAECAGIDSQISYSWRCQVSGLGGNQVPQPEAEGFLPIRIRIRQILNKFIAQENENE